MKNYVKKYSKKKTLKNLNKLDSEELANKDLFQAATRTKAKQIQRTKSSSPSKRAQRILKMPAMRRLMPRVQEQKPCKLRINRIL